MRIAFVLPAIASLALTACATYEDDLARGQRAFESNEHERALAIFRALEPDTGRLSLTDRAHYAYLRGMTDNRIGYKADARHWLGVASSIEHETPGSVPPDWAKRMTDALKELNEEVYTSGYESLTNRAGAKGKSSDDSDSDTDSEPAKPARKTEKKKGGSTDDDL